MNQWQIIIWCIKLILGGITSFLAILLWSKTRSGGWMCLVGSVLVFFAGIIFDMLKEFGIINLDYIEFYGLPVLTLAFVIIPPLLLIIALILFIKEVS